MPNEKTIQHRGQRRGPGSGAAKMVGSGEKAADFKGTLKQLLGMLRQDYAKLILAAVFALASVSCMIAGPRIMEKATNELQNYYSMHMMYPKISAFTHPKASDSSAETKALEAKAAEFTQQQKSYAADKAKFEALPVAQQTAAERDKLAQTGEQLAQQGKELQAQQEQLKKLAATRDNIIKKAKAAKTDDEKIAVVNQLANFGKEMGTAVCHDSRGQRGSHRRIPAACA